MCESQSGKMSMNQDESTDCERMSNILENKNLDLEEYRKLVKNYIDLVGIL